MCIDPQQNGFVGKGSDHLQLIKFWPSCAPGKEVCGGAKIFGSALLQPAHNVCVSQSAFSFQMLLDSLLIKLGPPMNSEKCSGLLKTYSDSPTEVEGKYCSICRIPRRFLRLSVDLVFDALLGLAKECLDDSWLEVWMFRTILLHVSL